MATTNNIMEFDFDDEYVAECPACGSVIDYCQGHGEMGDPIGFAILAQHDDDDHSECVTVCWEA